MRIFQFFKLRSQISLRVPGIFLVFCLIQIEVSLAFFSHALQNDTLAVIGTRVITLDKFQALYKEKLTKNGIQDNLEMRQGYLTNLVDDEILIHYALQEKLDRSSIAINKKRNIESQQLLNAYLDKHIFQKCMVTEEDLTDLYLKMNKKIKVSHIYADTRVKADSLYQELTQGADFAKMAEQIFTDPVLKEQSGSLGYISIDEMDPAFENMVFKMNIGEISHPVKTVEGYSIIRVDDIKGNPFLTEQEYLKSKERIKGYALKRKREEMMRRFSAELRTNLQIRINQALVKKLYDLSKKNSFEYLSEKNSLSLTEGEKRKTIVTSTIEKWNVRKLITVLGESPEWKRAWIHTQDNLEDFIAGVVLQKYILGQAFKENLHKTTSYREKVREQYDTYLLTTVETQIKGKILISTDSLRSYYDHHLKDFTIPQEIRLSAILVDDDVRRDSVRNKLIQGNPFSEVAKQYSIQTYTAQKNGDMGYFRLRELGDLGQEIFLLNPGEWLGPKTDNNKYLFVQCTEKKKEQQKTFEDVKEEIKEFLVALEWVKSRHDYARSLKKDIRIEVIQDKLRTMTFH